MRRTWTLADHRVFAGGAGAGGDALLFGAEQASLFAIDGATGAFLDRWGPQGDFTLADVPPADHEIAAALADARVLVPAARTRRAPPRPRPATCAARTAMPGAAATAVPPA